MEQNFFWGAVILCRPRMCNGIQFLDGTGFTLIADGVQSADA